MENRHMRSLMSMGAIVLSAIKAMPPQPVHRWKDDEPRKATKDRSKIKAARKQNRTRK